MSLLPKRASLAQICRGSRIYFALGLAASLLDFTYYSAGNILNSNEPLQAKAQLFSLVFADHLTLVSLPALGSVLRPSRVWPLLGLLYLLYCAADRTTLSCLDVHLGTGLQFARMLVDNPDSLEWVGGMATLLQIGKKLLEFLAVLLAAVTTAAVLPFDFSLRGLLAINLATWLLTALAPATLWTLCLGDLRVASIFPRTQQGAAGPLHDSIERFGKTWAKYADTPSRPMSLALPRPPHIVFIVGESWNASVVEELNQEIQPFLNRALRSRRHFSGANTSTFGLFALLSGRESCFFWGDLDKRFPIFLPTALKMSGYRTVFWGCAGYWPLDGEERLLKQAGFDSLEMGQASEFDGIPDRDRELFARLTRLLKNSPNQPQFVTLFTGSTHYPYYFPPEWDTDRPSRIESPLDRPTFRRRYRNSLRFSLNCLARFLAEADLSNTIVVVVGDHGESMGEDSSFGHSTRASHAQFCTPLWIWAPGLTGREVESSGHVDVIPTLLHLLTGKKQKTTGLQGYDLVQDPPRPWNFATTFGRPDQVEYCALFRGNAALVFKLNPTLGLMPQLKCSSDERARDRLIQPQDDWPNWVDALSQFWQGTL